MKSNSKCIAVIGSTGKAGKYILAELLRNDYSVRTLVRSSQIPTYAAVRTIEGDVCDHSDVAKLISGCDAVISALGHPGGDRMIFSEASKNIIRAMETHHVKRYILLGGINIDFPEDQKGPDTRAATEWMQAKYPKACFDRQEEVKLLRRSTLDWTMLRLPRIDMIEEVVPLKSGLNDCLGDRINVGALAAFVVSQLYSDKYVAKAPFIWNA